MRVPVLILAVALGLGSCATPGDGAGDGEAGAGDTRPPTGATAPQRGSPASAEPAPPLPAPPSPSPAPAGRIGVDVSHHQGSIDWRRVSADGISFAYLKATEGSTFTDPALTTNWAGARAAGLRVGGYHYFTLCSPPEPQADHFLAALRSVGAGPRSLPPVVDLELIGNCDPPPSRADLLPAVNAFLNRVEQATGRRVVVYVHPDLERSHDLVGELGRRQWVRRLGDRPPPDDWWLWQRSDSAQVDGIATPVDLDVMR